MNITRSQEFHDTGSLTPDSGLTLSSATRLNDIECVMSGSISRLHRGGADTHVSLVPLHIAEAGFHVSLRFTDNRLRLIELMACNDDVPEIVAAGGQWTRENELARKRFHEHWAISTLDCTLAIKPWVDPELPEPVMPAWPGAEHPRFAAYTWGEIGSYMDERACAALLIVSYTTLR